MDVVVFERVVDAELVFSKTKLRPSLRTGCNALDSDLYTFSGIAGRISGAGHAQFHGMAGRRFTLVQLDHGNLNLMGLGYDRPRLRLVKAKDRSRDDWTP